MHIIKSPTLISWLARTDLNGNIWIKFPHQNLHFVWRVLALEPAIDSLPPNTPRGGKTCLVLEQKIKESDCIKNILPSWCICIYLLLLCTTQQFWWIIECWPFDFPLAEICAALIRLCSTVLEKQIASDWIYSLSLIFLSLEQAFFLHAQLETMFGTAFLNIILGKKKKKLNSFKRRKNNKIKPKNLGKYQKLVVLFWTVRARVKSTWKGSNDRCISYLIKQWNLMICKPLGVAISISPEHFGTIRWPFSAAYLPAAIRFLAVAADFVLIKLILTVLIRRS